MQSIIFDTSIIRSLNLRKFPPEFAQLIHLHLEGKIRLLVPEFAAREWATHKAESADKALDQFLESYEKVIGKSYIKGQSWTRKLITANKLVNKNEISKVKARVVQKHLSELSEAGFTISPSISKDCSKIIDDYFLGNPPFKEKKGRSDLPDAFVLDAVVATHKINKKVIFVCEDNALRTAADDRKIKTESSIRDLLQNSSIKKLRAKDFASWWNNSKQNLIERLQNNDSWVDNGLSFAADDALSGLYIKSPEIPEDNNEACVNSVSDSFFIEIDWDECYSPSEGVLVAPINFECELLLEFLIYHSDSYDVPDWVVVEYGDPESDRYFEAYGSRYAEFYAHIVLGFDKNTMENPDALLSPEFVIEDAKFQHLT